LHCFADADKEYERLLKLDVKFPTVEPVTFPFGIRSFYVAAPEGNLLEIGSAHKYAVIEMIRQTQRKTRRVFYWI
jgi:hypothetical protein